MLGQSVVLLPCHALDVEEFGGEFEGSMSLFGTSDVPVHAFGI